MVRLNKEVVAVLILVSTILVIIIPSTMALQKAFTVQETDLVNVRPEAFDPDEEKITYSYGNPLNSSGQWQTTYDDAGEYGIEITAADGATAASERIILTVLDKNRLPQVPSISLKVSEGEKIALNLPERDLDGQRLSYAFDKPFNQQGEWATTYNDAGEYSLFMSVTDGEAESEFMVNISITEVNRPLFISVPEELAVQEGEELLWEIDVIDPDGDAIELQFSGLPEGAVQENESVSWTPGFNEVKPQNGFWNGVLTSLQLKQNLPERRYPMLIIACSGSSCQEKTTTIVVANVNRKPVWDEIAEITITAGEMATLDLTATDPDGDNLKYYFSQPFNKNQGSWKPKQKDEGIYLINVTASDGLNETSIPVKITVLKNNRAPKLKPSLRSIVVNEGQAVDISFKTKDLDHDPIAVSVENLPPEATFGQLHFSWTPSYDVVERSSSVESSRFDNTFINKIAAVNQELKLSGGGEVKELVFTASDGFAEQSETVTIMVRNENRKPKIIDFLPERKFTAVVGEPVVFSVAAKDFDNDRLNYEWSFSLHEPRIKGTNTVERTFVVPGKKKVMVTISDGLSTAQLTWQVTVSAAEYVFENNKAEEPEFKVYVIEG
ncbi:MAG TPA: hypothetical protein VJH68_01540 [Candidatus Nanoarchaeia archaeon]|nr:hypothetical protein [Candidatus Nanoarchaeia archaeon]